MFDKDLPESIRKGQRLTTMTSGQARFPIAPSKYKFARHGQSGTWVSELLPWTAQARRRDRADQDGLDRGDQPRSGRHLHLHGQPAPGPAQPGLLAQLRPGHDEPEPAGLRGDDRVVVEQGGRAGHLQPALGRRLPAQQAPGGGPAVHRATRCSSCPTRTGVDAATRRRTLDAINRHEPPANSTSSPTPRPRPGSPSTRWRSGCRPRSPS